ncbi:MAG: hypothetical protein Q9M46_02215 [Ghiorsea sp.]|nr:hypothetical protein [Ghiorsea sp.]
MNAYIVSSASKLCVVRLSNSLAIACNTRLDFECPEIQSISSRLTQSFPREVLMNSMIGIYAPEIHNTCVGRLNNSLVITRIFRLGVAYFSSHIYLFRFNQHFPSDAVETVVD